MKNKSLFTQIILLIILSVVCIVSTVTITFLFGAIDTTIFDFKNINFANMIPVLIIGIFISCIIVGIAILFVVKNAFLKIHSHLKNENNNNGGNKQ